MDDVTATPAPLPPPRYKQAFVTWLGAYPVITVILWTLGPLMQSWPLPVRSLVVSFVMVAVLTWLVLPVLMRAFHGWMFPR
jgi:antibiotic biosynthesis monooxygenase (ABM) superfamily enzyme